MIQVKKKPKLLWTKKCFWFWVSGKVYQRSRSTQNITLKDLIVKYDFSIMPVFGKKETQDLLIAKYGNQEW